MALSVAGDLPHCPKCLSNNTQLSAVSMNTWGIHCLDCGKNAMVRKQAVRGSAHDLELGEIYCNWCVGEIDVEAGSG